MQAAVRGSGDDRVLQSTRFLCAVIVPFLIVAFVVLYGFPNATGDWFAWKIAPTTTPMVLGGVYLGGAYYFVRAARAAQWHTIKVGFPPVMLFASLMGVATILHWDKFNHDHVAFWLWAGLYFTAPVLVAAAWWRNRAHGRPASTEELLLPGRARVVARVLGVLALGFGLFMFLVPERAVDIWPWMLTPLTARVLAAIFCLGVAGLGISADPRWSTARLMWQVQGFMLVLILGAVVRGRSEFDASNALTWLFAAGFLSVLAGSTAVWARMEGKRAAGAPPR